MMKKPKDVQPDPAWRVDVLVERTLDLWMQRFVDNHPLAMRLRQVGLDTSSIVRNQVRAKMKRERITDVGSLRRALRRG